MFLYLFVHYIMKLKNITTKLGKGRAVILKLHLTRYNYVLRAYVYNKMTFHCFWLGILKLLTCHFTLFIIIVHNSSKLKIIT